MWAPKLPVSTWCPSRQSAATNASSGSAARSELRRDERGAMATRGVGVERGLAHHQDRAAGGCQVEVHPAGCVRKDPQGRDAPASRSATASSSWGRLTAGRRALRRWRHGLGPRRPWLG